MSIQKRSKSAPQLPVSLSFRNTSDGTTPSPLHRRQQSFVHSSIAPPLASRPRDEPFALSGFFPSYMSPLKENDDDQRWSWLRGDEEEEETGSIYTASEDDPTAPPTPVEYDESENPDWVIQREDKLGILRLLHFLEGQQTPQSPKPQPEQGPVIEVPSKFLYLEQNVDSFEDMYDTYRARRQARDRGNPSIGTRDIQGLSTGPLFFPPREETEKAEEDWDDVLYRGWQRVTDFLF